MKKTTLFLAFLLLVQVAPAQQPVTPTGTQNTPALVPAATPNVKVSVDQERENRRKEQAKLQRIVRSEEEGIDVRVKDVARFKGVTSNQLENIGLVVGLNGTGDTQNTPFTAQLLANVMNDETVLNAGQLNPKNVAVVMVTAELPAFSSPGNRIDINVQSVGDATSLQGGYLLRTQLYGPQGHKGPAYVVGMGPISIGGFNVSRAGSSVQKNHTTAGRLPEMGIVIQGVDTQLVFSGKMYLQLNQQDFTTCQRLADQVNREHSEYQATPIDAGTIALTLPPGVSQVQAMSEIEAVHFSADTPATVVISENTGTVVMGGNVRIGPAVVAKGSLTVRISEQLIISQPSPLTGGQTVAAPQATVDAKEPAAQVTEMGPTTSVADLAMIFGALKISATDIIAILEALRDQGALKATLIIQ
ncbi:MAG TPA: flagellar basal body P-ring protein FlgI [Fimbriimonadaceae bacterium]|jgi:flagellar P-ring protein precursor FlgI